MLPLLPQLTPNGLENPPAAFPEGSFDGPGLDEFESLFNQFESALLASTRADTELEPDFSELAEDSNSSADAGYLSGLTALLSSSTLSCSISDASANLQHGNTTEVLVGETINLLSVGSNSGMPAGARGLLAKLDPVFRSGASVATPQTAPPHAEEQLFPPQASTPPESLLPNPDPIEPPSSQSIPGRDGSGLEHTLALEVTVKNTSVLPRPTLAFPSIESQPVDDFGLDRAGSQKNDTPLLNQSNGLPEAPASPRRQAVVSRLGEGEQMRAGSAKDTSDVRKADRQAIEWRTAIQENQSEPARGAIVRAVSRVRTVVREESEFPRMAEVAASPGLTGFQNPDSMDARTENPAGIVDSQWNTSRPGSVLRMDPQTAPAATTREFSFRIPHANGDRGSVEVRITERGGLLKVEVRSQDRESVQALRSELSELVRVLDASGYKVESWTPADTSPLAQVRAESNDLPSNPAPDTGDGQSGRQQSQDHPQQRQPNHRQPAWLLELQRQLTQEGEQK